MRTLHNKIGRCHQHLKCDDWQTPRADAWNNCPKLAENYNYFDWLNTSENCQSKSCNFSAV